MSAGQCCLVSTGLGSRLSIVGVDLVLVGRGLMIDGWILIDDRLMTSIHTVIQLTHWQDQA